MAPRAPVPHAAPPQARSYQQLLTKLLRHGAYPQLRKIIEKTLPADISPVLPLLLEEDRKRGSSPNLQPPRRWNRTWHRSQLA